MRVGEIFGSDELFEWSINIGFNRMMDGMYVDDQFADGLSLISRDMSFSDFELNIGSFCEADGE